MTPAALLAEPLRVLQDSDTVFEIENRPLRRAAITAAAIVLAAAMGLAALADGAIGTGLIVLVMTGIVGWLIFRETVQLTRLHLDRTADRARLQVTTLGGRRVQDLALSAIAGAEPRTRYGTNATRETVELCLVVRDEGGTADVPVPLGRADPEDVMRMAALIAAWLQRTAPGDTG